MNSLQPKILVDSFGGPVWSLCASPSADVLAAGCEDGTIRLFTVGADSIAYLKTLEKQEGRVLSVDWQQDGVLLCSGHSNGSVAVGIE